VEREAIIQNESLLLFNLERDHERTFWKTVQMLFVIRDDWMTLLEKVARAFSFNLLFLISFFYFILGIITSYHFARHSVIHLTIYKSLEEHIPGV